MANDANSFETSMGELQKIVDALNSGDLSLDDALEYFQKGVKLSSEMKATLTQAQQQLNKVVSDDDSESDF